MPAVIPFIPLIAAGATTAGTMYAANKTKKAAQLPPAMSAAQNRNLDLMNQRVEMTNPLYARLVQGVGNRMAASSQPGYQAQGGYPAPPTRSPGTAQAVSQLARAMPAPGARQTRDDRSRIIWGS